MTGQVKEDILNRMAEVGVRINDGEISFDPRMLRREEFLTEAKDFRFLNVAGDWATIPLQPQQFAFTICQVPVVYTLSDKLSFSVENPKSEFDQVIESIDQASLGELQSQKLFSRVDEIRRIDFRFPDSILLK